MELDELIKAFDELKASFRYHTKHGDTNRRETLIEFEGQFIDLKADLRPHKNKVYGEFRRRTDKSATAIKARIANAIAEGNFDEFPVCSFNKAKELAPASAKYKEFLEQKQFYETSYYNLVDLREDITSYINEIKDRLKETR